MVITIFNQKIVFKIQEDQISAVHELLITWLSRIRNIDVKQSKEFLHYIFPLHSDVPYAYDVRWRQPIGRLFGNWANDSNSFFNFIKNDEDVKVFDSLIRLNYASFITRDHQAADKLKEKLVENTLKILPGTKS